MIFVFFLLRKKRKVRLIIPVFDENGDIVFDMNETGQVQGATLDTSDTTLDTSDIDRLIS